MPKEAQTFTTDESTELLQFIAKNMVTKEDVRMVIQEDVSPMINKAKHEIMDYVDRKDREYKGELNLALKKVDKKVDVVITAWESHEFKNLGPLLSTP